MPILGALMGFSLLWSFPSFAKTNEVEPPPTPITAKADFGHAVTLTAYNAVPEQTDSDPFETASGAYSNPEVVAARSADFADELPFGTIIEIDGTHASNGSCGYAPVASLIGYRVIEDTMNPRYTDRIDILFDTKDNLIRPDGRSMNAAMVLGICKGVTIRVVGHVDLAHLPKTQAGLAALVRETNTLALGN